MKSSSKEKTIPLKDALRIFWDWCQKSISVEVCFVCHQGPSESVRVSLDGKVRVVDPEGVVTIAGDGREMDLDLRGSEVTYAREAAGEAKRLDPLDPDSILQVKFPDGEIGLVFPYRRVGYMSGLRRPGSGLEWIRNKLTKAAEQDRISAKFPDRFFKRSALAARSKKASESRASKAGLPLFPVGAFLVVFVLMALALTPGNIPELLFELGVRQPRNDPSTLVWVIPQDGNYYCGASVLNGQQPGRLMRQARALAMGYQPALGNYCGEGDSTGTGSGGSGIFAYYQTLRQGGKALVSRLTRISSSWLPQS